MIALTVNNYVWGELKKDATFNARYDGYRTQLGAGFIPFFPVEDNAAGDISWGNEPYFLYDSMITRPTRNVPFEKREIVMYTLVGTLEDVFDVRGRIESMFDAWDSTMFTADGYKVNDIDISQPDRTRSRDKVRQTYSTTLMLDVFYTPC